MTTQRALAAAGPLIASAIALAACSNSGGLGGNPCSTLVTTDELAKLTGAKVEVLSDRGDDANGCDHLLRVGDERVEIQVSRAQGETRVSDLAKDGGKVVPVKVGTSASIVAPVEKPGPSAIYGRSAWLYVEHCGVVAELSFGSGLPLAKDLTPVVDLVRPRIESVCRYAKK